MLNYIQAIRKQNSSQENIINNLKSMKVNLKSTVQNCPEPTTPLAEAAMRGDFDVVKYLIETKKVNPHESFSKGKKQVDGENVMALDIVIFAMKGADEIRFQNLTLIARYLIDKMQNFSITNRQFCMPLYYAIRLDHLEVVIALLEKQPNLLHAKDSNMQTLLHYATFENNDSSTKVPQYLLEKVDGTPRNDLNAYDKNHESPYSHALYNLKSNLLKLMLDNGAYPLSLYYNLENISPLRSVWESNIIGNKTRCINMLLAAGAGLEISRIPKEILAKYVKEERRSQTEILLIIKRGEKTALITTLEELRLHIQNKDGFEIDNLVNAVKDPIIKFGKHNKALRQIFSVDENEAIKPLDFPRNQFKPTTKKDEIQKLKFDDLRAQTSKNISLLSSIRHQIQKIDLTDEDNFIFLMEQFLKVLSINIALTQHKEFSKVVICHTASFEELVNRELTGFAQLKETHFGSHKVNTIYFMRLLKILKGHSKALRNHAANFHSFLTFETIYAGLNLAHDALNENKISFALTLLLNLNKLLSPDYEKSDSYSQEAANAHKLTQLLLLSIIYIKQEAYQNALACLLEIKLILKTNPKSQVYVQTVQRLMGHVMAQTAKVKDKTALWSVSLNKHCIDIVQDINLFSDEWLMVLQTALHNEISKASLEMVDRLKGFGYIEVNELEQEYILYLDKNIFQYCRNELQILFTKNPQVKMDFTTAQIYVSEQASHLYDNFIIVNELIKILEKAKIDLIKNADLAKSIVPQISVLTLEETQPKEKVKTRKESNLQEEKNAADDVTIEDNNYGFTRFDGFSPAVPIICNAIPENTLFLSMPINDKAFIPFLSLISQKDAINSNSYRYFPIRRIPEKGLNQQGVKISATWIKDENKQPKECFVARVKIINSQLRAYGNVIEEHGNMKLFKIDNITNKKEEKRLQYKK